MASKELILECHHCGNKAGHHLLCQADSMSVTYSMDNPPETDTIDCTYYLTRCKTCNGISLYYDDELDEHPGYINEAYLCYPSIIRPSEEIPAVIRKTFNEALKVERISFDAFAILIRRALELLCKDKQASGRNLKEQIEDLARKNIIPITLSEMGHTLRTLGNLGAHGTDYTLDITEIRSMRDFMFAMLEYVYVAPAKLNKLKESIKKKTD
jgi:hypothetical protein